MEENPHPSLQLHEQSLERTSAGVRKHEMSGERQNPTSELHPRIKQAINPPQD